jgi:hypothetical protein
MGIPMRRTKNKPVFTRYPYTELNWVYDYSMNSIERKLYFNFMNRLIPICEEHVSEWTDMFDCFDPFGSDVEIVIWRVVILLGYKHWNQYYYAKMDNDTLLAILNKRIKEFKSQKKVKNMEADFE